MGWVHKISKSGGKYFKKREKDDVWVLLKKIVGVGVEGDAELVGEVGVVCSGVSEESVVVAEEGFREKLAEVAEAKNGDLEGRGLNVVVFEVGFVVERLSGVDAADLEGRETGGSAGIGEEREWEWEGNGVGKGEEREGLGTERSFKLQVKIHPPVVLPIIPCLKHLKEQATEFVATLQ
ncbi:hypothetical protein GQ457_07G032410 [Hibiscus cannabinus]